MAESETDLGKIQTLLERVLFEVESLRDEIKLKNINPQTFRSGPPIIWYDKLPPRDIQRATLGEWNPANMPKNTLHRKNNVVHGTTDIPYYYEKLGLPFECKDFREWDETYAVENNLYFIEMTQVHLGMGGMFEYIDPAVLELVRRYKMGMVWFFPHEGFSFDALRDGNEKGWLDRLIDLFIKYDISHGQHFLVYNDLHAAENFARWKQARSDISFKFKKVLGYNFFHEHYWREFVERTCWRYNPANEDKGYRDSPSFGDWKCSIYRNAYIQVQDIPKHIVDAAQPHEYGGHQLAWLGEYQDIRLDEVLAQIPPPEVKDRDLLCHNARVRSHRPVIVSELHRLGYNNDNSFISFLARDQDLLHVNNWKEHCFESTDINQWTNTVKNSFTNLFNYDVQKEYFYKFWHKHQIIHTDRNTQEVDKDDRAIPVDQYERSFFALVSETLFGDPGDTDCLQLTEKIYKAIAYKIPFMVVGSAGTLQELRDQGYETFPEMFDESYDSMVNPRKRMQAIIDNLEKWRMQTEQEKRRVYQSVIPKIFRNYQHFLQENNVRIKEGKKVFEELTLWT